MPPTPFAPALGAVDETLAVPPWPPEPTLIVYVSFGITSQPIILAELPPAPPPPAPAGYSIV